MPVQVKERISGVVLALHQQARWFDQNDVRLLYSVVSAVGIAVENARLFGEVQAFSRVLERKVAERTQELAEEKKKIEAILASMADNLLVLDAEKRITHEFKTPLSVIRLNANNPQVYHAWLSEQKAQ